MHYAESASFAARTGAMFRIFVNNFLRALFKPVWLLLSFVFGLLLRAFSAVKRFIKRSYRRQIGDERFFTGRIYRAVKHFFAGLFTDPRKAFSLMRDYIELGLDRYGGLARYLTLLAVPVLSAVLLAVTAAHFGGVYPALRISVGDELLGYAASEKEYIEARLMAAERLDPGSDGAVDAFALLPEVSYSVELIGVNKFSGVNALRDRLIELSDEKIVNACGIYIDGEFLCAVKNEADARRYFDSVLEASPSASEEGKNSFVQQIDYVEGLYPDNDAVIWDSYDFTGLLESARENDVYYTASEGEKASEAAEKFDLPITSLVALNPGLTADAVLTEGARLLVFRADDFLTVKTVTTEVVNEKTAYTVIEIPSDALYKGSSRVVVNGAEGADQVTKLVTYVNGERISEQEVSRITVKEPVNERVQVGARAVDQAMPSVRSYGGILVWPAVGADRINSDYSYRWGRFHYAIDIGSSYGTSYGKTVVAAAEGVVVAAGAHSSYGYYVKIDHGGGMQTLYAHCIAGSLSVRAGQHVYAGQPIALIGQTGYATGPHLHFEVIINGAKVDPKPYLGIS